MDQDATRYGFFYLNSQESNLKRSLSITEDDRIRESKRFCAQQRASHDSFSIYGNPGGASENNNRSHTILPPLPGMFETRIGSDAKPNHANSSFSHFDSNLVSYNSSEYFQTGLTENGQVYGSYQTSYSMTTILPSVSTLVGSSQSSQGFTHSANCDTIYGSGLPAQFRDQQPRELPFAFDSLLTEKPSAREVKREPDSNTTDEVEQALSNDQTAIDAGAQPLYLTPDTGFDTPVNPQLNDAAIQEKQGDTCFGVIIVEAISSFDGQSENDFALVKMKPFGDVLKLNFENSGKYAGLVECANLCLLVEKYAVKLTGMLLGRPTLKTSLAKTGKTISSRQCCQARIVVHGSYEHTSDIGNHLSKESLFLQEPTIEECGQDVIYNNPHVLLRPGAPMPQLEKLSISRGSSLGKTGFVNEIEKNRFMRLFDEATCDIACSRTPISLRIRTVLKEHQISGVAMMIEKELGSMDSQKYPSLWAPISKPAEPGSSRRYRNIITGASEMKPMPVRGGILADDMGLGKSLTLLALVCSSLDEMTTDTQSSNVKSSHGRATLVITPKSTLPGWLEQIDRHVEASQFSFSIYHGCARQSLASAFDNNHLILTTYETMRSDYLSNGPIYGKTWYRVVLDEAHRIRNRSSKIFKSACSIKGQYRWCLTGTPIQNSLDDYGALLSFIRVPSLMDKTRYDHWITNPVKKGTTHSLTRLRNLVRATCLRRTKSAVQGSLKLPDRFDTVQEVELDAATKQVYNFFRDMAVKAADRSYSKQSLAMLTEEQKTSKQNILRLIVFLRLICDHGLALLPPNALDAWNSRDKEHDHLFGDSTEVCIRCGRKVEGGEEFLGPHDGVLDCGHPHCTKCLSEHLLEEDRACPGCANSTCDLLNMEQPLNEERGLSHSSNSPKIESLLKNLSAEQNLQNQLSSNTTPKSVVFSCWTKMLDLVQTALLRAGFNCVRLDGKMTIEERKSALVRFNVDPKCTVMLASISSAGEGVNLTAANNVHLLEPHYNPMLEAQAIDRAHRLGQTQDVHVTRYIVKKSIETYIQWVQKNKMKLIESSLENADPTQASVDGERLQRLQKALSE